MKTLVATLALALGLAAGCRQAPAGGARPAPSSSTAAAEINGVVISTADVDSAIGQTLSKLEEQIYSTRLTRLDVMIDDRLIADEAKKRGVTSAAFLAAEVTAKIPEASDADAPPMAREPVSPMKIFAGEVFHQRKPTIAALRVTDTRARSMGRKPCSRPLPA